MYGVFENRTVVRLVDDLESLTQALRNRMRLVDDGDALLRVLKVTRLRMVDAADTERLSPVTRDSHYFGELGPAMRPGCRRVMQEDHRLPLPQQRLRICYKIGGRGIPCERGAAVLVQHGLARLVHAWRAAVGLVAVDVVEHEHVVVLRQRGVEEDLRSRLLDVGPARARPHRGLIEQLIKRLAIVRVPLCNQEYFQIAATAEPAAPLASRRSLRRRRGARSSGPGAP